MARYLRDLLDAQEPLFSQSMNELERMSGHRGADVKLIGDITQMAHENMRHLGLSPARSLGKEVYQALRARFMDDADQLGRALGGNDTHSVEIMMPLIIDAARGIHFNRRVFGLTKAAAEKLIASMPPYHVMSLLGYESVETMLAHEDYKEIFCALRIVEDETWLRQFNAQFTKLTDQDFESRQLEIMSLDPKKYAEAGEAYFRHRGHFITHSKELGVIAVVPIRTRTVHSLPLRILPTILHYMNEIKIYSSFFSMKRDNPRFGEIIMESINHDALAESKIAGRNLHWRIIHNYLSSVGGDDEDILSAIQSIPHLEVDDLYWRQAEVLLCDIDPQLQFWQGRSFTALQFDGKPVSFNLFDIIHDFAFEANYENRSVRYFRNSLWNEIFTRYMGNRRLAQNVFAQLNSQSITVPDIAPIPESKKTVTQSSLRSKISNDSMVRSRIIDSAEGRLGTVIDEFDNAFSLLSKHQKTITIFGSARQPRDDEVAMSAYHLAAQLTKYGFSIVTGGGHGIMEAANKGTYEAGGQSIGLNIKLPFEQTLNEYTTDNFEFQHFFGRKVAMTLDASAFIYYPGGFGTFDELFEILVLQQTKKIDRRPIILVGSDFWRPWDAAIREVMLDKYGVISREDTDLYRIFDDIDEIVEYIISQK